MAKRRTTKSTGTGTAKRAVRGKSKTGSSGVADLVALGTAARTAARTSSGSAASPTKSPTRSSKASNRGGKKGRGGTTSSNRASRTRNLTPPPAKVVEVEASDSSVPLEQRIAERAYAIWEARGGNDHLNWLEAERQILSEAAAARPRGRA